MISTVRVNVEGLLRVKHDSLGEEVFDKELVFSAMKTKVNSNFFKMLLSDMLNGKVSGRKDVTSVGYFSCAFGTDDNPSANTEDFVNSIVMDSTGIVDKRETSDKYVYEIKIYGTYTDSTDTTTITGIVVKQHGYNWNGASQDDKSVLVLKSVDLYNNKLFTNGLKFSNSTYQSVKIRFSIPK